MLLSILIILFLFTLLRDESIASYCTIVMSRPRFVLKYPLSYVRSFIHPCFPSIFLYLTIPIMRHAFLLLHIVFVSSDVLYFPIAAQITFHRSDAVLRPVRPTVLSRFSLAVTDTNTCMLQEHGHLPPAKRGECQSYIHNTAPQPDVVGAVRIVFITPRGAQRACPLP